jgi:alkaline phosphatase
LAGNSLRGAESATVHRLGVVTDVHHAHAPVKGTRYFDHALAKLGKAVDFFNQVRPEHVFCLGDIIDSGDGSVESEKQNLREVEAVYSRLTSPRHYVFGNHCLDLLNKDEFCSLTAAKPTFYHLDLGPWRLVVLDACFRADGVAYQRKNFKWTDAFIPGDQQKWLRETLSSAPGHALVMVHQRLDGVSKDHCVVNSGTIRSILAESGKVRGVLAGHSHQNELHVVEGIPHLVLRALIEEPGPGNTAHGVVELHPDGMIRVLGQDRQGSATL